MGALYAIPRCVKQNYAGARAGGRFANNVNDSFIMHPVEKWVSHSNEKSGPGVEWEKGSGQGRVYRKIGRNIRFPSLLLFESCIPGEMGLAKTVFIESNILRNRSKLAKTLKNTRTLPNTARSSPGIHQNLESTRRAG